MEDVPPADSKTPIEVVSEGTWEIADTNWQTWLDTPFSRRRFLTYATLGVGAVIGAGAAALGVLTLVSPLRRKDVRSDRNDLGPVEAFPAGYYVKRRLSYQGFAGQQVEERAVYVRRNAPGFTDPMTGSKERFTLIWNRCAHLGCPVAYEGSEFVCPCHGGVYDAEGRRIAGPPLHSLDRFDYRVESGRLVVYGAYSLYATGRRDAHGNQLYRRGQLRTPGEPTGGLEGTWYPLQNGEDA